MACNEAGSGVLWRLETARSGGRVVVSTNNVVQLKTQWKTRCVGERKKAVEKQLLTPGWLPPSDKLLDGPSWWACFTAASEAVENASRTRPVQMWQRSKQWCAGVPLKEFICPGYKVLPAMDDSLRERLDALVKRATGPERPQLHAELQSKKKGAYLATLFTPKELDKAVLLVEKEARQGGGGKAAARAAGEAQRRQAFVCTLEEQAAVAEYRAFLEMHTAGQASRPETCYSSGPNRGEPRPGLAPGLNAQVTAMRGNSVVCGEFGIWHADDDGPPSTAVIVGTAPEPWVPPFFVEVPEAGMEGGGKMKIGGIGVREQGDAEACYHAAREQRWRAVLDETQPGGASVRAVNPSKAIMSSSSSGNPLSQPGHHDTGEVRRWTRELGQKRSAAQDPRPGLPGGVPVMFDGTSPHRAPGVMRSEGERRVLYLGYQGKAAFGYSGAPLVAVEPLGAPDGREGETWHPAFSVNAAGEDEFLLGSTVGGRSKKARAE